MATPKKLPGPAVSMIKTEPGTTSRNPSLRLPSFKAPRDMMLGGTGINHDARSAAARKIYVPNLNVQRKKNQEDVIVKTERSTEVVRGKGRGARGSRGRGERGRGRGSDLVQSETGSVFSQGVAADIKPKRSASYSDRESTGSASEYKSKIKASVKVLDEKENKERLAALLQDDFIDDPGMSPNTANMPTQLPTLKVKTEILPKKERGNQVKTEDINGEVQVKQLVSTKLPLTSLPIFDHQEIFTMKQLLELTEPQLILLKLPDFLPQFEEQEDSSRASTSKTSGELTEGDESNVTPERLTLPEGRVGKLQRLKSGRVRLVLGDQVLYTELGVHTSLKQDLISVNVAPNTPGGDMMNFGKINARIISSPLYNPQFA